MNIFYVIYLFIYFLFQFKSYLYSYYENNQAMIKKKLGEDWSTDQNNSS